MSKHTHNILIKWQENNPKGKEAHTIFKTQGPFPERIVNGLEENVKTSLDTGMYYTEVVKIEEAS